MKYITLEALLMTAHSDPLYAPVLWLSFLIQYAILYLCRFMPFLVLSGQLCPPGIEGTLFALFMSVNNFGSTLSSFAGGSLASVLHISSENFDNLALGIFLQAACTLVPIFFLFLIPPTATGAAHDEHQA